MEMFQIRYVIAAAQLLNFTRAAEECNVSQPALTKAIRNLERELGAPLFHREGRRVLISDFGASVLPHLQQIVTETETTRHLADNFRLLEKVPVRLGVMSTIGHAKLARFLSGFHFEHPGVELEICEAGAAELCKRLIGGELDLAVLNPLEGLGAGFRVFDLYRERYVVVFPPGHRLAVLHAVALGDLSEEPYVDRLSCEMREMVTAACTDRDVRLYARFRSEREDWVQSMVLARIGFAFMPEYSVTAPELLQRPLVDPAVERSVALVSVAGRPHSPAAATLMRAAQVYRWPG